MIKVEHKSDNNVNWSYSTDKTYPLSTVSHSYHQDWQIMEGIKCINYRVITCPHCNRAQKIDEKKVLTNIQNVRCPWCNETFVWDFSMRIGAQYDVEIVD